MKKVRVYELAKELELESKVLVDFLTELGADIKNHMSTIDEDIAEMVKGHFSSISKSVITAASMVDEVEKDETPRLHQKKAKKRQETVNKDDADLDKISKKSRNRPKNYKNSRQTAEKNVTKTPEELEIQDEIIVKDLAVKLNISPAVVIKSLMKLGVMAAVNQTINFDTAELVCTELGVSVKPVKNIAETVFEDVLEDDPQNLQPRPPVVTIMGHVDHGKTTLLDSIRKSRVTASEAGGITQHIGAYQIDYNDRKITFLDTPGHAAFTEMRSRGAQVTDIAVLVVAADDGVMPQTVEAINHAKAAKVPIIVAINKIDRPQSNPDRVKQELAEHELISEDWGGDTIFVEMSALNMVGVDDLLEMILLITDMAELKANPSRLARGTVIEAQLDKGRGPVATVLISAGTLRVGDNFAVGNHSGRIRALVDDRGRAIKEAYPSQPVEIVGISEIPEAGDVLVVTEDEQTARQVAHLKQQKQREQDLRGSARANLDDLFAQIQMGEVKDLYIVLKADVQGTVEALRSSLEKLSTDEVRVNVIHQGVGGISESDVQLAIASDAVIIGFNVRPEPNAKRYADREKVEIRVYRVIYDAIDEVKSAMSGMLTPDHKEETLGRAEVRDTFRLPSGEVIAGSYVIDGKILRSAQIRVLRDNVIINESKISSLRRFKDDVREVAQGYECGIGIDRFNDIKVGDALEAFIIKEIARSI